MKLQAVSTNLIQFAQTLSKALEDNRITFREGILVGKEAISFILTLTDRKKIVEEWHELDQVEKYDIAETVLLDISQNVEQEKIKDAIVVLNSLVNAIEYLDIAFDTAKGIKKHS